jgi:hypothetical protein
MSYAVPSLQPIRDEIASEVAIINDEIDSEVVINAGWVDVARSSYTEYENTTGQTYEVMMRVKEASVRLRHPDGAIADLPGENKTDLFFQLKPGESVELVSSSEYPNADFAFWSERQV